MYDDLTGQRFGRLLVLHRAPINHKYKNRMARWICKCDCGKTVEVSGMGLKQSSTRSCGCYSTEVKTARYTKHGLRDSRLYNIWINMTSRCNNPKNNHYKDYGGRGIRVCREWLCVGNFLAWGMANGYNDVLELDRIDNNGDYCPNNCRFTTRYEQARNRRNTVNYTFGGKTMCQKDWAREMNMSLSAFRWRLEHGWTVNEALSIAPGESKNRGIGYAPHAD